MSHTRWVQGPGNHVGWRQPVGTRTRRIRVTNSWGYSWGVNGDAFIGFDDMAKLLADQGEAAIPVGRLRPLRP